MRQGCVWCVVLCARISAQVWWECGGTGSCGARAGLEGVVCGAEWSGVEWSGAVWCGVVLCGVVWCVVVWCGVVGWCGVVWGGVE